MKNLSTLIASNNFKVLNVSGGVGNGKLFSIRETIKEMGYQDVTFRMNMMDVSDVVNGFKINKLVDEKIVIILDDLDRAQTAVFNKTIEGIVYGKLFDLELTKDVVVIATSVDKIDFQDSSIENRTMFLEF